MYPSLSIIIPTLNEAKIINCLFDSISKQTFRDFEVIVVDGGSKDNTVKKIKSYAKKIPAIKIIVDRKRSIGRARNIGAANARGNYLLFLDADVVFDRNFLKDCLAEFEERYLEIATCYITPLSPKLIDHVLHEAANAALKRLQYISPTSGGFCIFITKRMHNRINGFDARLKMAEDINYVERASRLAKFRVLKSCRIKISVRRLEKEGRAKLVLKYLYVPLYRAFVGEVTKPIFKYDFGNHDIHKKIDLKGLFIKLEKNFMAENKKQIGRFRKILEQINKL